MQANLGGIFRVIVCVVAAVTLTVPAWADSEVFVVSASANGDASYTMSNGDGSFAAMEILQLTKDSGITAYALSYGNGLGDFDNDGDYDYIAGFGYGGGDIYIFEKLGDGNQFGSPMNVASWNEGYYPMDLAVADFNDDGNLDFIMSYMYSATTGLYLGNGSFGFTYIALENTAPSYSAGIDTADFNGDGLADFVVAPNSPGPIYVNLNNGDGTFTKSTFNTHDGNSVYGIAAADFNNDRMPDIATAYHDYLIIYLGNGDGTFQWSASHEFDLNRSALDNYDFDGDGNQDLVAANFGSVTNGIAILLGNGDGTFTFDATYDNGITKYQEAVTAPPYEPALNLEPVAALDPVFLEITAGEEIEFDGSGSYDEDGEIVSYDWDFGDGSQATASAAVQQTYANAAQQTYVYNEAGQYVVTLTVTDDKGATASVTAEVHVSAVPVTVSFTPRSLNQRSRGKWIAATIKVPAGYNARTIDIASVQLAPDGGPAVTAYTSPKSGFLKKFLRKYGSKRRLTLKFDRQAVIDALGGASGRTVLNLEGKILRDGKWVDFSGAGTIKVIEKKKKKVKISKKK
ncbi:MAG: VCBS repeat-containing protein [Desulfobacterales bacterium]|nr:MAG: VCBS repeat-containing protein [Desulfobacterales bacterium]